VTRRSSPGYLLASVALLVAVVAVYATWTARRTQAELRAQLEQKATALAEAIEVGSRNAVRANALVEQMIAERLLDNARLIDVLLARPFPPEALRQLAERNGLRRIDLLDLEGRAWTPPWPPAGMPGHMGGMMRGPGERPMTPFMWGPRWHRWLQPPDVEPAPATVRDRRFWEGSVFGVAIGATSFPGIIAVHADAGYVLNFRREIGIERQLAELGRQPGVAAVRLLGPDLTILADSDAARAGARVDDASLAGLAARPAAGSRLVERDGVTRFEVVRPLALDGGGTGLLAIELSTEPMTRAWQRDVRAGALLAGAALLTGGLGLGFIFWLQQRHLSERRRLEAEMGRRERLAALGDVAAAFAHEVRNPLNAVSMGLQRLHAEFAPEPAAEYARFVELMQGEVRRLNAIVEQFIGLARPLPLKPAAFAVDELLRELAALVEGQARDAGVTVRLTGGSALPPLVADRDHVKQVLLNLVLNAVQAMAEGGGVVTLGAEAARDAVTLTVADTGPGISPDVRARIFDPYFTTRRGGLGLGLTIARRIVEAHGGTLTVDSEPGRGARFRVTLPLSPP
jgi:signal transduction histidine kinase